MDVAIAIDAEAIDLTLKRNGPATFDLDGNYVFPGATTTTIRGMVQPASGRRLMDLPEGIRYEAQFLLWSRSEIRADDVVTHAGSNYRVMYIWPRLADGFTRAAMGLVK